ncbi:flagellar hook-basal body complex protein [Mobilicoccus caccae]|uniref:Flagellar basal body protein n=1 Tax=Mobilicoccus caccae TaxID=1859295 RepID=A0ABQ6IK85_9MICO|nr:flagellar hook-basal body complex protein [Mobilicoccus caccae]GMA38270.1 flagellar basal body protein [Mobilicoccus caccae]
MIRSMWSAVSGLRNHQIYLDVTGNNIANVNTHGYKYSRAVFEDSLNQVVRNAAGPDTANGSGGLNPTQIGLGVRLGQISGNFTQGGLQVTNVPTDIAIQGDGFFTVRKGETEYFTRNGAFSLDKDGNLTTSDGSFVLGIMGDGDITAGGEPDDLAPIQISTKDWQNFQISPNGKIMGQAVGEEALTQIGQIGLVKFNNPAGLDRVGGTMFRQTLNSGDPLVYAPNDADNGMGFVTAGTLELSNVDLAGEFTNLIMAQRGFQANSKVVTASDEVLNDLINMKR